MGGDGVPESRLKQFGFRVKRELFTCKKEGRHFLFDLSVNTRNCEINHNRSNALPKICRLSMRALTSAKRNASSFTAS